eukprot:175902_1
MGTCQPTYQRSHSTCEDDACNCFCNDAAVKHRQMVSLTKDQDDIPKPTMHHAKFYPKTTDLSNKTLCSTWHRYFFEHSPSQCLSIALIDTTSNSHLPRRQIRDYFAENCHYLPVLQLNRKPKSDDNSLKRTLHVDDCTVPVKVSNMDLNAMESADVNMFLFDGKTDINAITHVIQSSRSACILVKTDAKSKASRVHLVQQNQLCRHYNIPCFELSLNSKKSMNDLFVFAIKYYWFCAVIGEAVLKSSA